jgi:hypothetical protein
MRLGGCTDDARHVLRNDVFEKGTTTAVWIGSCSTSRRTREVVLPEPVMPSTMHDAHSVRPVPRLAVNGIGQNQCQRKPTGARLNPQAA